MVNQKFIGIQETLDHLESFKLNIPSDILDTINIIHNKYCKISSTNSISDDNYHSHIKNYWLYTTLMTCAILSNNCLYFRCFYTKNVIKSIYSSYFNYTNTMFHYYYFPQDTDTFILIMGGGYNLPVLAYYPHKNIYIRLTYPGYGGYYDDCKELFNNISLQQIISNINNISNINDSPVSVCFFAWCMNPGHYIWNEVSGIYPLIATKLVNNIDVLVVGEWDIFNISNLIYIHNPKCKILKYNDFINSPEYVNKNIKYARIGEGYILSETQLIIRDYIKPLYYSNKFVLSIILKLDQRGIQNITDIYINIINRLTSNNIIKSENLYLIIDGLYKHETEQGLSYYNTHKNIYESGVHNIINNINNNIEYKSLIGMSPYEVFQHYNNVTYFIGCGGANIYCIRHVYKKNGCVIYPKFIYDFSPNQDKYYVDANQHNLEEIVLFPDNLNEYILNEDELYNNLVVGIQKKLLKI